jgi:hypothetical protein
VEHSHLPDFRRVVHIMVLGAFQVSAHLALRERDSCIARIWQQAFCQRLAIPASFEPVNGC